MTSENARATELLADRATYGLDPELDTELKELCGESYGFDTESWELAAAAIDLAYTSGDEELPLDLQKRLQAQAITWDEATSVLRPRLGTVTTFPARQPSAPRTTSTPWMGWIAAAACLALAVAGWWPAPTVDRPDTPQNAEATPQDPPPDLVVTPASLRAEMITNAKDLQRLEWTATDDPAVRGEVTGDVVWSTEQQMGFLRFTSLAVNDPAVEQYQLWIFDPAQDERFPIDGGVFDIASSGEVIIPIDARLPVTGPTLFAITVEKPGGVVVSSRKRLPLLAQVV